MESHNRRFPLSSRRDYILCASIITVFIIVLLVLILVFTLPYKTAEASAENVASLLSILASIAPTAMDPASLPPPSISTAFATTSPSPKMEQTNSSCRFLGSTKETYVCKHPPAPPDAKPFYELRTGPNTACYFEGSEPDFIHAVYLNCILALKSSSWNGTCNIQRLTQPEQEYNDYLLLTDRFSHLFIFGSYVKYRNVISRVVAVLRYRCVLNDITQIEEFIRFLMM